MNLSPEYLNEQFRRDVGFATALHRLYLWRSGQLTSFTARLYDCIQKADSTNKVKLTAVYPSEMAAWDLWRRCEDEESLWRAAGFYK